MRKITLAVMFATLTLCASAQLQVTGKLRVLRPLDLKIENLNGETIVACKIENSKEFKSKKVDIVTDLYKLTIGERVEMVLLSNNPIAMRGYLNDKDEKTSSIIFEGMEMNKKFKTLNERMFRDQCTLETMNRYKKEDTSLDPIVIGALIYVNSSRIRDYETFKAGYDGMPETDALVKKFLIDSAKSRESFKVGGEAVDFKLVDKTGKEISLSDFKGKLVLLDFWASWCGPCRAEMKSLHTIYEKIKGDDLVFISISLDEDRNKWLKAMEVDNIPWVALWEKDGFENTKLRKLFGFNHIPFIVLISKEGKTLIRELRGEKVREEIEKARNK